jgi:hypothetical protein
MDKSIICRELDIFYRAQKFQNVYFYNTIFHTYLYTILQGVNNGYYAQRKQFFNKEDIAIMKKGIMNKYELKLWILARVDTKLMVKYSENQINKYIRRLINLTFSLFFSIPNKKQKPMMQKLKKVEEILLKISNLYISINCKSKKRFNQKHCEWSLYQ